MEDLLVPQPVAGSPSETSPPDPPHEGSNRTVIKIDNFLNDEHRRQVYSFLCRPGWQFGWKSVPGQDQYSFWHKHFAGHYLPDHVIRPGKDEQPYDCADELRKKAVVLHSFWRMLEATVLKGHTLLRCYANGSPYGAEGSLHTDSVSAFGYTSIYYPHDKWDPNWGGETVFFDRERADIITSVYPKPGRLVVFRGTTPPHRARRLAYLPGATDHADVQDGGAGWSRINTAYS